MYRHIHIFQKLNDIFMLFHLLMLKFEPLRPAALPVVEKSKSVLAFSRQVSWCKIDQL